MVNLHYVGCAEKKGESVSHITSECSMLAQKEYKRRHDNLARTIHWNTCEKYKFTRAEKWYEHQPQGVIESEEVKPLWDFNIQCDKATEGRRSDIVIAEKRESICKIIDVAVPNHSRVNAKEQEKIEKYQELRWEVAKLWKMKKVEVISGEVGTLRTITNRTQLWLKKIRVEVRVELCRKPHY